MAWTDNSNSETGYKIERSTDGVTYTLLATLPVNSVSYSDMTIIPGTNYYYRITAYNVYGNSPYSVAPALPSAPVGLNLTPASSRINISWTDVAGESGYEIERSVATNTAYSVLTTVGLDAVLYSDTPLTPESIYYYRIRAYNVGGYSLYSAEVNETTLLGPPAIPNLLSGTVISTRRIELIWSDVGGETGYNIERSSNGTNYEQLTTINADTTVYTDTTVASSNTYYYRVNSYNTWGNSDYSNVISGTTPAPTPFMPLSGTEPTEFANDGYIISIGYKFSPIVNGTIIALGRYIAYTSTGAANSTVILWQEIGDGTTGIELRRVTVPAERGWQWANLSIPISVTAGQSYRVSVICDINSGDYWYGEFSMPDLRENINILENCYTDVSDSYPDVTWNDGYMYGWADIEFLAE